MSSGENGGNDLDVGCEVRHILRPSGSYSMLQVGYCECGSHSMFWCSLSNPGAQRQGE